MKNYSVALIFSLYAYKAYATTLHNESQLALDSANKLADDIAGCGENQFWDGFDC